MNGPATRGAHHLGLTVSKLEESARFFTSELGWREVRRRDDYPAIYVSDGSILVTLWATQEEPFAPFDRRRHVGLHHIALHVETEDGLYRLHSRLVESGTRIEFAPEPLGRGPARHMMCLEPSGIRVEFIWPGR